ncbi:hypothetical protein GDO86_004869 [Hymenochirus boettgeri]|uniref:Caprin-2 n=1 Tax=Hymenochirus boettgeri TaxID=247094 RepID=A0A8T2J726_9PIPI|nr:hypothetical protein GDO86_004869 [Hymenochirus boettgeri]
MVQLSPFSPKDDDRQLEKLSKDFTHYCQQGSSPLLQSSISSSTPFQAYETYIENGLICLKHKIRNIEKKKVKLEDYRDRLNNGEELNQDQLEAVEKYEEVIHNLEFAKDLQKTLNGLGQELLKTQKKALRREHALNVEEEKKRLRTVLQIQYVFQALRQDHVLKDLKEGQNGAANLAPKEFDLITKFANLVCPKHLLHMRLEEQMNQCTIYFWNLLEGTEKQIAGSTCKINFKQLKVMVNKLLDCGYFENVPEPLVEIPKQEAVTEEVKIEAGTTTKTVTESSALPTPSVKPWDPAPPQPKKWGSEPKERRDHIQKISQESKPAAAIKVKLLTGKYPELRKQKLEALIDKIKGTYNFMQESMLDFEPSQRAVSLQLPCETNLDPILQSEDICSIQNAEVSALTLDAKDDGIVNEILSEPDIPTPPVSVQLENPSGQAPLDEVDTMNGTVESSPKLPDPLPERSPTPLPAEQLALPKTPTNSSVLQIQQQCPTLSPRHTPVLLSSSPFHGMQTIFKVNAPLPPRKEQELNSEVPYSQGYHQTFTTASTQTLPHCPLDTGVGDCLIQEHLSGSPYTSAGIQVNGNIPCYTSSPNILPRMAQPIVTSRGTVRGTSRGRTTTNGYRYPAGYKAPESYRAAQCITNGSYNHMQCSGREFSTTPFISRDGSTNLCHKRGTMTTTARTNSRAGWSESSQISSPDREDSFNSTDSGHGDSSMDMSMTSQAATILPVHVYPLPQQMRVAFSAARTSNFAPGTLDQPIVFDLLLNNLGDSFDFQVGRFMCPVNGTYVFIFHMLKLAVNVPLYVNLMKNEEVLVSAYANDGAPDHETASNHAVLQLFQGDQIWLRLHRGAIYGSSWKYSTFSGYLLYQD